MGKEEDCNRAIKDLTLQGYEVRQLPNFQLQVNRVNFWAGTGKWFDPATNESGYSFNEFVQYLERDRKPRIKDIKPDRLKEFEQACLPLIEFMRKNCSPHDTAVINLEFARLDTESFGFPVEQENEEAPW